MIKTMRKKNYYETPSFKEVEFDLKAVLCTSESEAEIEGLVDKYDWSDMWNNN